MQPLRSLTMVLLCCAPALGSVAAAEPELPAARNAARAGGGGSDELAGAFRNPPAGARPQTWWHWMNGNISREGITADLEAMSRIGVGGAQIFNATQGEPAGPVGIFSPEWYSLVEYAISEAHRLGLEIGMENCAGWSEAGGPWVTPAQAMQRVVWSELRVHGPRRFSATLPPPPLVVAGYCRDIAVLAFPAIAGEARSIAGLNPAVECEPAGADLRPLLGANGGAEARLPVPTSARPCVITLHFRRPQPCGSIRFVGRDDLSMPAAGLIEASDDGVAYRTVGSLPTLARGRDHPSMLATFPGTTAPWYRIVITRVDHRARALVLTAIDLGGERLAHTEELAGFRAYNNLSFFGDPVPAADTILPGSILDLSSRVKSGRLDWTVPPGNWTIVRFCHTPTGQMNRPAPAGGSGLECDKMSRRAADAHFNALMGRIIDRAGPLAGKTFTTVVADSWEAGSQNWTPEFRREFERRRGYDPLPFLPVITGRVVGDVDRSQRFLWDFRTTIGELIADNFYGELRNLCHRHNMQFEAEAPGINEPAVADELECKGRTDVPMGEFWMDGHCDTKEVASAAHLYQDRIAAAEAFTARPQDANWTKSPFDHKMLGDLQFTLGINRFVFHRYAHQPWLDRFPGMTMGRWGTNFERTNTWWEQACAWMIYLTRCQYLLQRGIPVADVCYFYGENTPNTLVGREPELPPGIDYDGCNAEGLLTRMGAKDGALELPNGVSYRILWLAPSDRMTPGLLRKIRALVSAGATVVGRRPDRSPSLSDYPRCDADVRRIAAQLWGDCDGAAVKEHRYGKGRVIWGMPIAEALREVGVTPDFLVEGRGRFAAIHRRIGDADVYFVSSQNRAATSAVMSFRIKGRAPELWHPDSGLIERPAEFDDRNGRTTLPMRFDPAGSVFVVFRRSDRDLDPVRSIERDDGRPAPEVRATYSSPGRISLIAGEAGDYVVRTASGKSLRVRVPAPAPEVDFGGPWTVRFPPGWRAPADVVFPRLISWTRSSIDGVKYFSGTATYETQFQLPPAMIGKGRRLWLDLGGVKDLAEVTLNGKSLGVLWKPPFAVEITKAARAGTNALQVRVTNLWPNRMIGDQHLPPNERVTWSTYEPFAASSPLRPSGLLGPVRIQAKAEISIREP